MPTLLIKTSQVVYKGNALTDTAAFLSLYIYIYFFPFKIFSCLEELLGGDVLTMFQLPALSVVVGTWLVQLAV